MKNLLTAAVILVSATGELRAYKLGLKRGAIYALMARQGFATNPPQNAPTRWTTVDPQVAA